MKLVGLTGIFLGIVLSCSAQDLRCYRCGYTNPYMLEAEPIVRVYTDYVYIPECGTGPSSRQLVSTNKNSNDHTIQKMFSKLFSAIKGKSGRSDETEELRSSTEDWTFPPWIPPTPFCLEVKATVKVESPGIPEVTGLFREFVWETLPETLEMNKCITTLDPLIDLIPEEFHDPEIDFEVLRGYVKDFEICFCDTDGCNGQLTMDAPSLHGAGSQLKGVSLIGLLLGLSLPFYYAMQ